MQDINIQVNPFHDMLKYPIAAFVIVVGYLSVQTGTLSIFEMYTELVICTILVTLGMLLMAAAQFHDDSYRASYRKYSFSTLDHWNYCKIVIFPCCVISVLGISHVITSLAAYVFMHTGVIVLGTIISSEISKKQLLDVENQLDCK